MSNKIEQYKLDIPVTIDRAELVKQFKVERTRPMMEKYLDEVIALAQPVAHPKALYGAGGRLGGDRRGAVHQ
jgi:hypothetical protein